MICFAPVDSKFKKNILSVVLAIVLSVLPLLAILAQAGTLREIKSGDPTHKLILDAIRAAMEWNLAGPVEFSDVSIVVKDSWASVRCEPRRPGGGKVDLRKTQLAGQADIMDGVTTTAFLQFRNKRWYLVGLVIGPSDAAATNFQSPEIPDELVMGKTQP